MCAQIDIHVHAHIIHMYSVVVLYSSTLTCSRYLHTHVHCIRTCTYIHNILVLVDWNLSFPHHHWVWLSSYYHSSCMPWTPLYWRSASACGNTRCQFTYMYSVHVRSCELHSCIHTCTICTIHNHVHVHVQSCIYVHVYTYSTSKLDFMCMYREREGEREASGYECIYTIYMYIKILESYSKFLKVEIFIKCWIKFRT